MQSPNWFDVFGSVCGRGQGTLEWGLPEAWVHAELYAEFKRRASATGWVPFSTELPYVTFCPVQPPKRTNRDWKVMGAVKWVDLYLWSRDHNAWCWFEFKVRQAGSHSRQREAALQARNVFRKDVVALMGFDAQLTADAWVNPDRHTTAYWFERVLKPKAKNLHSGKHHFAAVFLQLEGELDPTIGDEKPLVEQIRDWFSYRGKQTGNHRTFPDISIASSVQPLIGNHALLVCEWSLST